MTSEQEKHLQQIKRSFEVLVDSKYRRGQEEHGGDLFRLPIEALINNAIDEAIDQVVYLLTIKYKLESPQTLTK